MRRVDARPRGALERDVLIFLAAAGRPVGVQQVIDGLGVDLAYTTVMTTLARLHAKNAVARRRDGRAYVYFLTAGADEARAAMTAHQMRRLLDAGTDRAQVLSRFVADLGPDDERLLEELLRDPTAGREPREP